MQSFWLGKPDGVLCAAAIVAECLGNPPAPDNGTFACGSSSLPGTTCNGTCLPGYKGSYTSACGPDGSWGNVTGACGLIGEYPSVAAARCAAHMLDVSA